MSLFSHLGAEAREGSEICPGKPSASLLSPRPLLVARDVVDSLQVHGAHCLVSSLGQPHDARTGHCTYFTVEVKEGQRP